MCHLAKGANQGLNVRRRIGQMMANNLYLLLRHPVGKKQVKKGVEPTSGTAGVLVGDGNPLEDGRTLDCLNKGGNHPLKQVVEVLVKSLDVG